MYKSAPERSATERVVRVVPMGVRVYKIIASDCFVYYAQTERKYNTAHNKVGRCEGRQGILFNANNFAWPWATHAAELEPSVKMTTTSNRAANLGL